MPDILRYAGFANDPDPSLAAPAAVFHVDVASISLDAPSDTEMIPPTSMGREARTHRPGYYAPSGGIQYAFDIRTIPYFLRWALGGYKFTSAVAPAFQTHEIWGSAASTLPLFIARTGKDVFEHIFRGATVNSLELSVEGEFAMANMDIVARTDASATLLPITSLILPAEYPLAFHEVTAKRNTVDISARVNSLTLTINNNVSADGGRSIGSRHPRRLPSAERDVRLAMNMYFEDTDILEAFWGGATGPAATGSADEAWEINFNAGADGSLLIELPRCTYMTVPTQPSGRDPLFQSVNMKAFETTQTLEDAVTTVSSSILATAKNDYLTLA